MFSKLPEFVDIVYNENPLIPCEYLVSKNGNPVETIAVLHSCISVAKSDVDPLPVVMPGPLVLSSISHEDTVTEMNPLVTVLTPGARAPC